MRQYLLECCVDSVESAMIAQKGGADRLELCANLIIGGTTPGIKLFEEVKKHTTIPIRVLIRPRYGDFLYTEYEYSMMQEEVSMFLEAKAEGIVIGCLKADGTFDLDRIMRFKELVRDKKLTVHRAFDLIRNPLEALEQLKQLKVDTILTSGQEQSCLQGKVLIQNLIDRSDNKINILVGGGVDATVARQMLLTTDCTQLHMSGKELIPSQMCYVKDKVSMGLPLFSEYEIIRAKEQSILDVKNIMKQKEKETWYFPDN